MLERARYVVAAPGRGGAAWLSQMARENDIETHNNEVDIGVRVEVPNSVMDHLTQHLYEAKLVYYSDTFENKVRTFCMNPGGLVSEEHYEGGLAVVNGHSYADQKLRTHNTNFAMLVSTRFTEPFDQPIEYGRYIAQLGNMLTGGGVMVQRLGDLLKGRRTDASRLKKSTTIPTLETAVPGDLSFVLPHRHLTSIIEAMRAFDHVAPRPLFAEHAALRRGGKVLLLQGGRGRALRNRPARLLRHWRRRGRDAGSDCRPPSPAWSSPATSWASLGRCKRKRTPSSRCVRRCSHALSPGGRRPAAAGL